jgi:hypothetical protein
MEISVFVKGSEDKFPRLVAGMSTIHLRPEEYIRGRLTPSFHGGATICSFWPDNYPSKQPAMEVSRCLEEEYEVRVTRKNRKTKQMETVTVTKRDGYNRRQGRLTCIERFLNRPWCLETILGQNAKLYNHVRIVGFGNVSTTPGGYTVIVEAVNEKFDPTAAFYRLRDLTVQPRGIMATWPRPAKTRHVWAPKPVVENGQTTVKWQPTYQV